jgi:DNA mismatch repair protein MutS2
LKESRYYFDVSSRELSAAQHQLAVDRENLESEKDSFEADKNASIQRTRQEADQYVRRVKREANEALDELKELIKDKSNPPKWHEVEQKSRKIKELGANLPVEKGVRAEQDIGPGDYVLVKSVNQSGQVLEGPNAQGEVAVQIGSIRLTVHQDQLQITAAGKEKMLPTRTPTFLEKTQSISREIDLRGKYSEDAIEELDKYLEDANLAGLDRVRVIHGKGTGALRTAIRNYLKGHRYVQDFQDGGREEGGYGVTVITLH